MTAKDYIDVLIFSLDQQQGDFERMIGLQASYDNKIDKTVWPMQSEIPTAQHFIAVEEQLGPAMDMLFPETNGIQMIPTESNVKPDQWENAEWGLWVMANYEMRLKEATLRSIKDCFKCSVGYTIIEPCTITPETSGTLQSGGKKLRITMAGEQRESIRARYLSPGRVVPYPTGTDFNGDEATPLAFVLDFYSPWQIEAMYDGTISAPVPKENLQSSPNEIFKAAKSFETTGISTFIDYAEMLGGRKVRPNRGSIKLPDSAPMSVPILRVFEKPGKEICIALKALDDGITMFETEVTGQVMSTPIVKWSSNPDGNRWFPMSAAEADQSRAFAYDLWLNFFFDMMTATKDARLVVNKSALAPGQRRLLPKEDIFVTTSARDAATYLENPRIDPNILSVGATLQDLGNRIQGKTDVTGKNYTRGGANAFQDMLNSTQGRQRLSNSILETGGLIQCYQHIFALMKKLIPEQGFSLRRPVYDTTGKNRMEARSITAEDICHGYNITIDTSTRRMLGGMTEQTRIQLWQLMKDDPNYIRKEVDRLLPMPEVAMRRAQKSEEEMQRIQEDTYNRQRLAELSARGAQPQQGQPQQGVPQEGMPQEGMPAEAGMMQGEGMGMNGQ